MIDTILNLMFRCSHRRLTRPVTPVSKSGVPHGETYVVCLDCGKQFAYDLKEMRVGKPIEESHKSGVLMPESRRPGNSKLKYAVLATIPLAVALGSLLRTGKTKPQKTARTEAGSPLDTPQPH
jgi:DNA-directed RNA polymerase subunit RPC12/RpoP